MKKDLAKQIYKDSGWQIDKDTKTTDYKPAPYCIFGEDNAGKVPVGREDGLIEFKDYEGGGTITLPLNYQDDSQIANKPEIPHNAITLYPNIANPFTDYNGLSTHWMKCLVSADLSTYTLFFAYSYEGTTFPIRVLTDWDLFNDNNINCVKITANEASTLTLFNNGDNTPNLQYSTNGIIWKDYTGQIAMRAGSSILLRGNNPDGFNFSHDKYSRIEFVGNISISGNIMGLLDNGEGETYEIPNDYCFYALFYQSYGLTHVSENFLPATTLKLNCYESMFNECINLKNAPNLPATELVDSCYWGMFFKCYKLEKAPELPALTLQPNCYKGMFYGNTSLRIAPTLPATTLAEGCYQSMFSGCNSLFSVKIAYTGNFANITNAFTTWLANTPSYAIIYYNGTDTTSGASAIPTGWQKVTF